MKRTLLAFSLLSVAATFNTAWGHGNDQDRNAIMKHERVEQTPFGRPGDPKMVSRTIRIRGSDEMRFSPNGIRVKQGETIRFLVKNEGKVAHEMVLGTMPGLMKHYEQMKKSPGMPHSEPYMAHLKPGATEEIVWHFTKAGDYHFACLIPGHLEAGMKGEITVVPGD